MRTLLQDLRFASRQLRKSPAFALTSVVILGLGIGASTAIFSAVSPTLLEPLPYPQSGQIMMIWDIFEGARSDVTFHTYREVAERTHSLGAVAVMEAWQPAMTGPA
jgi:putative ABC transport system permease protein